MATLMHPIVADRVIEGEGTSLSEWQEAGTIQQLKPLHVDPFRQRRVCIIAPHPDDEILGCAGLIQQLDTLGCSVLVIAVTNGTASHPHSSLYPAEDLNRIRPSETLHALESLQLQQKVQRIGLELTDGQLFQQQTELYAKLQQLIQPHDVLVSTFEQDGHPDHEVTGQIVKRLSKDYQLEHLQVLIWAWHWAKPQDQRIPWQHLLRLDLSTQELQRKQHAVQCFKSQLEPDSSTGQEPIVSVQALARLLQPWEVYIHASHL